MASSKMQPAELTYSFTLPTAGSAVTSYVSISQIASFVNRRLYEQGKCYYINRIVMSAPGATSVIVSTLPDTWVTANAWVKAKALWKQMNNKVLHDNPSTQGKWADFKVFFDAVHRNGGTNAAGPTLNLLPFDFSGNTVRAGEWVMSEYVQPQHTVNTGTGEPLAADEYTAHMLGDNIAGSGSPDLIKSVGIIQGYADTRARVQAEPNVPADMSTSWMTLLTDDGSQEPELAQLIEDQNDLPPYDETEYVGGGNNFNTGVPQAILNTSSSLLVDKDLGFKVPLGLLKILSDGSANINLTIHLTPGSYKGLMATEVKQ